MVVPVLPMVKLAIIPVGPITESEPLLTIVVVPAPPMVNVPLTPVGPIAAVFPLFVTVALAPLTAAIEREVVGLIVPVFCTEADQTVKL